MIIFIIDNFDFTLEGNCLLSRPHSFFFYSLAHVIHLDVWNGVNKILWMRIEKKKNFIPIKLF